MPFNHLLTYLVSSYEFGNFRPISNGSTSLMHSEGLS